MCGPPIVGALEARKKQIADGLAAADRGRHELELAARRASETMHEAKIKASEIIAQAEKARQPDRRRGQERRQGVKATA